MVSGRIGGVGLTGNVFVGDAVLILIGKYDSCPTQNRVAVTAVVQVCRVGR